MPPARSLPDSGHVACQLLFAECGVDLLKNAQYRMRMAAHAAASTPVAQLASVEPIRDPLIAEDPNCGW